MHTTASFLTALAGATIVLASPAPAPPRPLVTPRPVGAFPGQRLAARQDFPDTGDDASWLSCFDDYQTIMESAPTPAADIIDWLITAAPPAVTIDADNLAHMTTMTSMCDEPSLTPPASLSSAWSSYEAAVSSWGNGQSSAVSSLQSACPGEISAVAAIGFATDAAQCTTAVMDYVSFVLSSAGITPAEPTATKTTSSVDAPEPTGAAGGGDKDETGEDKEGEGEGDGAGDDENAPSTTQSTAGVAAARETGLVAAVAAVALGVAGVVAGF